MIAVFSHTLRCYESCCAKISNYFAIASNPKNPLFVLTDARIQLKRQQVLKARLETEIKYWDEKIYLKREWDALMEWEWNEERGELHPPRPALYEPIVLNDDPVPIILDGDEEEGMDADDPNNPFYLGSSTCPIHI